MVIDGRTIGLGSTCASTSLLQYEIDVPLCELQKKIGIQPAVTAYKLCAAAINKLEAIAAAIGHREFKNKQSLYFADRKKEVSFLGREYAVRKTNGFDVSLLDKAQINGSFHFDAPGAILSAKAAQTNAYTFTHHLLQHCMQKGMQVFDRTYADKITHAKDGVVIKTAAGHVIRARKLIYANGYEAVKYVDKKIVNLQSTYAVCTEQMIPSEMKMDTDTLMWNTAHPYLYMRTTGDNRILIGGRDEKFADPRKRDALIDKKTRQLAKDFKKLFPAACFKSEFSWAGTFGSTRDGLPFIGNYKKMPNSYFALGFGGNGITFSLIAAEILSNELIGKTNPGQTIFSFDRL